MPQTQPDDVSIKPIPPSPAHDDMRPLDAVPGNWVDRHAPTQIRPHLRLMRADRPIGVWLLWLPCLWGTALALMTGAGTLRQMLINAALFALGAFVMRGAGCTYNDIVDRDIDAAVARTAGRPLPAGQISPRAASALLIGLCLIGLGVLLQFNRFTILLGFGSLALVAAYPFMKRITWWPQAWLGLTFNFGALIGYASITGGLSFAAMAVYGAGVLWTLGYDTIYAHQDKEDDALVGVKSSARALGERTRPALALFYAGVLAAMALAGLSTVATGGRGALFALGLLPAAGHLAWQVRAFDADDPDRCLALFKANRHTGMLLLAPFLLASAL